MKRYHTRLRTGEGKSSNANSMKHFITGLLGYNRIQTSLLDRWMDTSQTKLREQISYEQWENESGC